MVWNPNKALTDKAEQLGVSTKEVFGGFGSNPFKEIQSMDDVRNKANYLSEIDGHYPRGMSDCFVVGISGDCGILSCPVFRSGECKVDDADLFVEQINDLIDSGEIDEAKLLEIKELYPRVKEFQQIVFNELNK